LFEEYGKLTWRVYAQDYSRPSNGACATSFSRRNQDPYLSFTSISSNLTRCQNLYNDYKLYSDIKNDTLADFSFLTMNNNYNGHNNGVSGAGSWLVNFFSKWYYPYLNTTWNDTLVMVTFDEDSYSADGGSGTNEGNHVYTLLKHPCINSGTNGVKFNHYSITTFLETNFFLGSLGRNDATANNFGAILTHKPSCSNESWAVSSVGQVPEGADEQSLNEQLSLPHTSLYSALVASAATFLGIVAVCTFSYYIYRSQTRSREINYDVLLGSKKKLNCSIILRVNL